MSKHIELATIDTTDLTTVTGGGAPAVWGALTSWAGSLFGGGTNVNVNTGAGNNTGQGVKTEGSVTIGNNNAPRTK